MQKNIINDASCEDVKEKLPPVETLKDGSGIVVAEKKDKLQLITKFITYTAMFLALNLLAKVIQFNISVFSRASFFCGFIFITSIIMGPYVACFIGLMSDLLSCFIYGYTINPFILLASGLYGLIFGLIYKIPQLKPTVKIILGAIITFVAISLFLNSYGTYWMYSQNGRTYWAILSGRILTQGIPFLVNTILVILFTFKYNRSKVLQNAFNYRR